MGHIFSVSPGHVVAVRMPDAAPMAISLDGWGGFQTRRSIVQSISITTQGNFQFLHTLRGFVYVYVFGERMGELTLSGLSFAGMCDGGNSSGLMQVINYYDQYRVSKTGQPVSVWIASAGFRGFLIGSKFDIVNPEAGIGNFSLQFKTIPPQN